MANMGYCKFENTVGDLQDCINTIEEFNTLEEFSEQYNFSSDTEKRAFNRLVKMMFQFATEFASEHSDGFDI